MKKIIYFLVILMPLVGLSQQIDTIKNGMSRKDVENLLEDGYTLASGWTFNVGDTILFARGTLTNGDFAYIYQSPISLFSERGANNKIPLHSYQSRQAVIKDFIIYGTKKTGWLIIAKIGVGLTVNYWVELENAANSFELKTPDEYVSFYKKQTQPASTTSKADELKKWKDLFDAGAITKEEYEAQKKRILAE